MQLLRFYTKFTRDEKNWQVIKMIENNVYKQDGTNDCNFVHIAHEQGKKSEFICKKYSL